MYTFVYSCNLSISASLSCFNINPLYNSYTQVAVILSEIKVTQMISYNANRMSEQQVQ